MTCQFASWPFAVAMLATTASADLVQIRDAAGGVFPSGNPNGFYLEGTAGYSRVSVNGGPFHTEFTGVFVFEIDHLDGGGWEGLQTFCLEPTQAIPFGKQPADEVGATYDLMNLSFAGGIGAGEIDALQRLWANAFGLAQSDSMNAAAFQYLVWELTQDDAYDLNAGDFMVDMGDAFTANAAGVAELWMQAILEGDWTDSVTLSLAHHPTGQDLLVQIVPAPGALALLAMLGVVGRRRRRD